MTALWLICRVPPRLLEAMGWLVLIAGWGSFTSAEEVTPTLHDAAARIDDFLAEHWQKNQIRPAEPASDAAFLRRLTLDLAGRIPTPEELDAFLADPSSDKRRLVRERLMTGPEFALHFGQVLDEMIQGEYAGNLAFVDYLRRSLRDRKTWEALFREMMLGPWDKEQTKAANYFLDKRAKNTDLLTVDATRVFFGVDISCAQCHDHPLTPDWSQDHYYGMVSFFHRTTGGKGAIGEKKDGNVSFVAGGKPRTAKAMFLSGYVVEEPSSDATGNSAAGGDNQNHISRRAQLVEAALQDRTFFSRAIVNRLWEYFYGCGLVTPIDQMHSENEPAVPGLLEWLADDFAESGYDLHRLVAGLVGTRAYQLSSQWKEDASPPAAEHFAVAQLRPLGRQQMAASLLLATGNASLSPSNATDRRMENYTGVAGLSRIQQRLTLEEQAAELASRFDPRMSEFQSSSAEALFLSNAEESQRLFQARDKNLPARLAAIEDTSKLVRIAIREVLSRPADDEEAKELAAWFDEQDGDRAQVCSQLVWALVASAEFRFNH